MRWYFLRSRKLAIHACITYCDYAGVTKYVARSSDSGRRKEGIEGHVCVGLFARKEKVVGGMRLVFRATLWGRDPVCLAAACPEARRARTRKWKKLAGMLREDLSGRNS